MYINQLQTPSKTERITDALLVRYDNDVTEVFAMVTTQAGDLAVNISRSPVRERTPHSPVPCPCCGKESTTLRTCVQHPIRKGSTQQATTEADDEPTLKDQVQQAVSVADQIPFTEYLFCENCWETVCSDVRLIVTENQSSVLATNI